MAFWDNALNRWRNWLLQPVLNQLDITGDERERLDEMLEYQAYVAGNQRATLPVKSGKPNDNITINLLRKVVNKSVSLLFGAPVTFDLGGEEADAEAGETKLQTQEDYLNAVWEANKRDIFLRKLGRTGAIKGTVYVKIVPDGTEDGIPRMVSLDPILMKVETNPQDVEEVTAYVQRWTFKRDGKRVWRRETTRPLDEDLADDNGDILAEAEQWVIVLEEKVEEMGSQWRVIETTPWPYPFPPILHGQNLPVDGSPYGEADIASVIAVQDRVNYIASNISKIIRYHGHPKTVGTGFQASDIGAQYSEGGQNADAQRKKVEAGSDEMVVIPSPEAKIFNLEMQSELVGTMNYFNFLVQSVYDLSDTVNLSNVKDKLGQLTNFGIRVLYQDALEKLADKRVLYGDLLVELNRRLLVLKGFTDATGGAIVWPTEVLPQNEKEEAEMVRSDMDAGLVSVESARGIRGYNHETEKKRITEQRAEEPGELGEILIRNFNRG